MALKLGKQAFKSYLKITCEFQLRSPPNKKLVQERTMVKLHEGQTSPSPPSLALSSIRELKGHGKSCTEAKPLSFPIVCVSF